MRYNLLTKYNKLIFILTIGFITNKNKVEQTEPELKIYNLYEVEFVTIKVNGKSLEVSLNDESFIYFEDYISLKSDIFLFNNYQELNEFDEVNISFTQKGRDDIFTRSYSAEKIDSIYKELSNNKYLERNYSLIVKNFNVSEIWNLRSEVINVSKYYKDEAKLDYLELIKVYSKHQKERNNIKESAVYARMILIRDMFVEIGIEDVWEQKRKKAPEFIQKLNNIIEK